MSREIENKCIVTPWVEWLKAIGRSEKTILNSEASVRAWLRDKSLASVPPSFVTKTQISSWVNNPADLKVSSCMANLAGIRSYFEFCVARGLCATNPAAAVSVDTSKFTEAQQESRQLEPFTDAEYKRLINYLSDEYMRVHQRLFFTASKTDTRSTRAYKVAERTLPNLAFWKVACMLSRTHGLQLQEICSLKWVEIDHYKTTKPLFLAFANIPLTHKTFCFQEQRECIKSARLRARLSVQFYRIAANLDMPHHSFRDLHATWQSEQ